ncbi:ABC transporter permease subunit, partial [Rhizobium ruizarguesonis]
RTPAGRKASTATGNTQCRGVLVQVVSTSMLTALSSAYIKTARAKGVGSRAIVFVNALRNGLLPVITVASDQTAGIVKGAVIVETVFGF